MERIELMDIKGEFTLLCEFYDFWDAVDIYLAFSDSQTEQELFKVWNAFTAEQKKFTENLYELNNLDIVDTIIKVQCYPNTAWK